MAHYKIADVAEEVKDRERNPAESKYDRFVGLEHYVSGDVEITRFGSTERLESTMKVFKSGDILIARRNVYLKRASTVSFDGLTSGDSIVLRAKNPVIARILPFVLNTDDFWDYADQYSDGTMSKRLSPKLLLEYEFDLPDDGLEDFADLLWAANETRNSYRELLKQTDELVKSQFIEMFGDPVENPYNWPRMTLKAACNKLTDGTHFSPESYAEGDFKYITAKNIKADGFDFSNLTYLPEEVHRTIFSRCNPEKGDVLYIKDGATTGIAMINSLDEEFSLLSSVALLKYDRSILTGEYLKALLNYPTFYENMRSNMGGAAITRLTVKKLCDTTVMIAPIEQQKRFAEFVEQSDKSKFELKQSIERVTNLMKSLMQQDFAN